MQPELPLDELQKAVERLSFCLFNSIGSLCRDSKEEIPTSDSPSPSSSTSNEKIALEFAKELSAANNEIQSLLSLISTCPDVCIREDLQDQITLLSEEDAELSVEMHKKANEFSKYILFFHSSRFL